MIAPATVTPEDHGAVRAPLRARCDAACGSAPGGGLAETAPPDLPASAGADPPAAAGRHVRKAAWRIGCAGAAVAALFQLPCTVTSGGISLIPNLVPDLPRLLLGILLG